MQVHDWLAAIIVKVYRSPQEDTPTIPTACVRSWSALNMHKHLQRSCTKAFSWIPAIEDFVAAMHGRPRWRHYMAFEGDQAVAMIAILRK
ncbi:MAG: hypothetical protein U0528_02585 [Anaerolineae bacterium]